MNRRTFLTLTMAAGAAAIAPKSLMAFEPQIDFYEVAGQTVFPVYGAHGGLAAQVLLLPMIRFGQKIYVYGHKVSLHDLVGRGVHPSDCEKLMLEARQAFLDNWDSASRFESSLDGGNLPMDGQIAVCEAPKRL